MVQAVSSNSMPPNERAKTGILGQLWRGKTIDFFGPRYGLPNAISAHQKLLFLGAAHQYARIRIQEFAT